MKYEVELQKLKNSIVDKSICLTIDKTTNHYGHHAVNSFDDKTKLARIDFLTSVNALIISQFVMDTIHFYNISY